ncbi:glycosyltransferase family 2 protein [Galbitalea soli]|uniref:Galactosyltransferase C-terminal domain-containing protein n=1 Tax=Galbitalea soli TaxID=1268042 RepID=A0A7C9PNP2_9MICO|nr:hypothetical protein [Galbitalea soli]NEM91814.1 hypothetical protein [Galbitalea soli]NYJ29353.1 hypothetical protein [Galbitalea soli]
MLSVVIPWRPQASRVPALELLTDWYERTLPGTVIRLVDTDDPVFNLARCRNAGMADADPDDVVVINDADTIPERGPLLQAVSEAATSGLVHLPYTEYHWLGARGTAQYASGMSAEDCDFELVRGACSGVYVATPQTWFSHGGQDERFRGWGFEDAAWYVAHGTLLGEPPRRHHGRVYALHHETQLREGPQYDANAALMQRYRDAESSVEEMREFVFGSRSAE